MITANRLYTRVVPSRFKVHSLCKSAFKIRNGSIEDGAVHRLSQSVDVQLLLLIILLCKLYMADI